MRTQDLERLIQDPWASTEWIAGVTHSIEPSAVAGLAARLPTLSEQHLARLAEVLQTGSTWHNSLLVPLTERLLSVEDQRLRLNLVRFAVEHPDARSTSVLEKVLTQPTADDTVELVQLAMQGLVRIGTPEALGIVSRYLEQIRHRPFAYSPCDERRCAATDRDGDGWPDDAEQRLGTSADEADTDGDGLSDPRDRCPLHKSSNGPLSEDDRARQAAFIALTLSLPSSIGPLEVSSETPCFEGASAPLLHLPDARWHARPGLEEPGFRLTMELFEPVTQLPVEGQRTTVDATFTMPRAGFREQVDLVYRGGGWWCERVREVSSWSA